MAYLDGSFKISVMQFREYFPRDSENSYTREKNQRRREAQPIRLEAPLSLMDNRLYCNTISENKQQKEHGWIEQLFFHDLRIESLIAHLPEEIKQKD